MGADVVRNRALSTAEDYHKACAEAAFSELDAEAKRVIDTIPLFITLVADKMEEKAQISPSQPHFLRSRPMSSKWAKAR